MRGMATPREMRGRRRGALHTISRARADPPYRNLAGAQALKFKTARARQYTHTHTQPSPNQCQIARARGGKSRAQIASCARFVAQHTRRARDGVLLSHNARLIYYSARRSYGNAGCGAIARADYYYTCNGDSTTPS